MAPPASSGYMHVQSHNLDSEAISSHSSEPTKDQNPISGADRSNMTNEGASTCQEKSTRPTIGPWNSSSAARFPVLASLALLAYLLCTAGNVVVLVSSNGAKVDTWNRVGQLSTFLSISAAISNLCLALVYNQGLAQAFWIRSLHGSSIAGLHHQWDAGQSFLGALKALAAGQGLVSACAMFAVALSALRSPLNQAAVRVVQGNLASHGLLDVQVSQKLPDNYTAYGVGDMSYGNASKASAYLTSNFDAVMLGYNKRAAMTLRHAECGDSCETTINGFGFDADCTTVPQDPRGLSSASVGDTYVMFSTDVNIWAQNLSDAYWDSGSNSSTSSKREPVVLMTTTYDTAVYNAGLNITVFVQSGDGLNSTLRHCLLQPSVMAYPVTLTNGSTVTLNGGWSTDKQIEAMNYTGPFFYEVDSATVSDSRSTYLTTVGGFQSAGSIMFKSLAFLNDSSMPIFEGLLSNIYFNDSSTSWSDPTDDILNAFWELSFRTSLYAATDTSLHHTGIESDQGMRSNQTVAYTGYTIHALYSMNWRYMMGGLVVSLLAALSVLPLFHGFWDLGREVSMNPFEIAMAFDAPLLAHAGPHCGAGDIVKHIGDKYIMYGASTTQEPSSPLRLRFGLSGDIWKPMAQHTSNLQV